MTFVKKPIAVNASQWWPPDDSRHDPKHVVGCEVGTADIGTITVIRPDAHNTFYSLKTISGWAKLKPGDWIIIGPVTKTVSRDIYPCDHGVFLETYDQVKE